MPVGLTMLRRVFFVAGIMMAGGCLTPYPEGPDPEQVRLRTEIVNLHQQVERMQNRFELMNEEQDRLVHELERLRSSVQERDETLAGMQQETDRRLRVLDEARQTDRQFVVEEITRRIGAQLARIEPAPAAPRTERGRYHEVRTGETLSEIAAAYRVKVNVIVQANDIDNPDRLRVGQRLFIPD